MKTTNYLLLAIAGLVGLGIIGYSFGDEIASISGSNNSSNQGYLNYNKMGGGKMGMMGTGNHKGPRGENGFGHKMGKGFPGNEFIDFENLSDEQKTELNQFKESHKLQMDELMTKGLSGDALKNAHKDLMLQHFQDLKQFVSQDKLDQFNEFIENIKNNEFIPMGKGPRGENGFGHKMGGEKFGKGNKYNLTELSSTIKSKIDNLSNEQKQTLKEKAIQLKDGLIQSSESQNDEKNMKKVLLIDTIIIYIDETLSNKDVENEIINNLF